VILPSPAPLLIFCHYTMSKRNLAYLLILLLLLTLWGLLTRCAHIDTSHKSPMFPQWREWERRQTLPYANPPIRIEFKPHYYSDGEFIAHIRREYGKFHLRFIEREMLANHSEVYFAVIYLDREKT